MTAPILPRRRCLACGVTEAVADNGPIWPLGWRCGACGHVIAENDGIPMFAPELADTISGMDPNNFEMLAKVEAEHFWFVARNELIVGLINKFFPNARRFLEIGCGNGAVLSAVAQSRNWERLVGSELHQSGLAFARKRLPAGVEFVQMD
ncbi:class I SAM-dependent methyltransferase, partial [Staphylococcus aureus]|uniref:class I SAM-dependent methyltransferase n=1 Tax=Staphylococcus aureus TaxID=1280 RepID=UPI0016639313